MGAFIPILMISDLHQAKGEKTRPITTHNTIGTHVFFIAIRPFSAYIEVTMEKQPNLKKRRRSTITAFGHFYLWRNIRKTNVRFLTQSRRFFNDYLRAGIEHWA
jgi:hypothetical protein